MKHITTDIGRYIIICVDISALDIVLVRPEESPNETEFCCLE